jgi:ABC-type dipeptide/oligopeptide/nickel transport system ATPase component
MKITEEENDLPRATPTRELMNIFIEGINDNIPNRNGSITAIIGGPGTGKSSLLLSMFRNHSFYKKKYNHIYLFTPEGSFKSVVNHPFKDHDKVFHDLHEDDLYDIEEELLAIKEECLEHDFELEHSVIIIDDFASDLKDKHLIRVLKKMLTKSRHILCSFIFTLQAYNMLPLVLRKQISNVILFKPKNKVELESVRKELIGMNENKTQELMDYIFDSPYNHLDIDTASGQMRKNFNLLKIED